MNPAQYYLVGLQVFGLPGLLDSLSPIGTSGVTFVAALNPCVGDYSFAFVGLQVGVQLPTPVDIKVGITVGLSQLAISKSGAIDPAVYPNLAFPSFWTVRCVSLGPERLCAPYC